MKNCIIKCPKFLSNFRFGVCCLFTVSAGASQITQNCTYIQNPSFPSVYSDTTSLRYTINKCSSEVCQVRLDFETFNIAGPAATTEATGGLCVDSFVVTGTSGLSTPVICGLNTGEHSKSFHECLHGTSAFLAQDPT